MTKFNVPAPEAGEHAIITFGLADVKKLNEKYGGDWVATILTALDRHDPVVLEHVVVIGLKGGQAAALLDALPTAELCQRVADALLLRIYGRTAAELDAAAAGAKA